MANTLNLGNGQWATKEGSLLGYNSENNNYKPLPFTFERASSATRVNKDGLIETVGADQPRVDYLNNTKGALKLEPQSTNLITYSEDVESWGTSGVITKQNNVAISPDGTLNAGTITSNASNFGRITQTISVSANSTYTGSLFIKKVQSQTNYMGIGFVFTGGVTDVGYVIFDAVNGIAVSADARIDVISEVKDFGDYWNLQSTATDSGGNTSLQFNIYATLSTNGTVTGSGVSSLRTIWGMQLEQGSYATSYIPTSGSAVTRLADSCNNGGNEQVINSTEGVLYAEISALSNTADSSKFITISDGTYNNRASILFSNGATNQIRTFLRVGGVSQIDVNNNVTDVTDFNKVAFSYKENDFKVYINGSLVSSDTSGSVWSADTITKLSFSEINTSAGLFNGNVKDVRVYNTALTDQELAALTQV